MFTITGQSEYSYQIEKINTIFNPENPALLAPFTTHGERRRFILIDSVVHALYGQRMTDFFSAHQVKTEVCVIEAGDYNKNEQNYLNVFKKLCHFDAMRRDEPLLAIGGGVITDLGGFVASTYRRGIPHIKVPTTLMGYVDASVGIKTGVNFGPYKNRMGSFEIPSKVLLDKTFLNTLDARNIINGIGEIIKLAIILDAELFSLLEKAGTSLIENKFQCALGDAILDRSIAKMVDELASNLYENDLKRKVDFGHTFSLAIESASNYQVMHGEAVAIDVLFSCCIAAARNLLTANNIARIFSIYQTLGLPTFSEHLTPEAIAQSVEERIMHRNGQQLLPIPTAIGECTFINDLSQKDIYAALNILKNHFLLEVA